MKNQMRYTFLNSRSGEIVPAIALPDGSVQALHSTVDPLREAQRLVSSIGRNDFVIFLGLGGGFAAEAALELTNSNIAVIDFDKDSITGLFTGRDYSKILNNSKVSILIDNSEEEIKSFILENFIPSLCGGIKTIPLRTRIEYDKLKFEKAAAAIQEAIDIVSGDYTVQSHFGIRWFSNIIRNVKPMQKGNENFFTEKKEKPLQQAAIAAAGPSLDMQMPSLSEFKSHNGFIISSDTALGALLHNNIEPDVVVSIDCQHISYYHFIGCNLQNKNIPLVLDIASPPLLAEMSPSPIFFSGGHPLTRYISAHWRNFPHLDTSGGNVTYACLSLAEILGAQHITLFGADFSYIRCQTYARGTYVYPYFNNRQNRLSPMEAQMSAFLYRSPFLPNEDGQKKSYYETSSLRFYRKKLEEKVSMMDAGIKCAQGLGAPINLTRGGKVKTFQKITNIENTNISGTDFLEQYRDDIAALPEAAGNDNYLRRLNEKEKMIFTTLLPYAAAIKKRNTKAELKDLIEEVKRRSIREIDIQLNMVKSSKMIS
jgi:hypothetical protein